MDKNIMDDRKNDSARIVITEEMNVHKEWYINALDQTVETLPEFINHLMNDYTHDYGTICHAITACGLAAMHAADNSPSGGITGFQAEAIMWEFIKHWTCQDNQCGMRLLDYDRMLYPQYEDRFDKTISKSSFKKMQEIAEKKLEECRGAHPAVARHWQSIVAGVAPFGFKLVDD